MGSGGSELFPKIDSDFLGLWTFACDQQQLDAAGFLCTCFGSCQIRMGESGGILKLIPRSLGFRVGFRRAGALHPPESFPSSLEFTSKMSASGLRTGSLRTSAPQALCHPKVALSGRFAGGVTNGPRVITDHVYSCTITVRTWGGGSLGDQVGIDPVGRWQKRAPQSPGFRPERLLPEA